LRHPVALTARPRRAAGNESRERIMQKLLSSLAIFAGLASLTGPPARAADDGMMTLDSPAPAAATLDKLEESIRKHGLKVFGRIDHAAAAKEAGLSMPAATVVIFGNPAGGTPNFLRAPTLAIDLPLKALVWDDAAGKTHVTANTGQYVMGVIFPRHGLHPAPDVGEGQQKLMADILADATR
jgi:uncharacterized protein (DUF302 family)